MISAQRTEEEGRGQRRDTCARVKVCQDKRASRGQNHKRRHVGHKSAPVYLQFLLKMDGRLTFPHIYTGLP